MGEERLQYRVLELATTLFAGEHGFSHDEKGGVKVMIKDKPKTEEVITDAALKESIGKAAFAYTDKFIGPREAIGAKGAGLSNRLRAALKAK